MDPYLTPSSVNIESSPTPPITPPSPPLPSSRSKIPIIILGIILILIFGTGGLVLGKYLIISKTSPSPQIPSPTQSSGKPCTQEAKICLDGSAVGRTGPNCEFAPCPATKTTPTIDPTANWKTYQNTDFNIQFNYPGNWDININDLDKKIVSIRLGDMSHSPLAYFTIDAGNNNNVTVPFDNWIENQNQKILNTTGRGSTGISTISIDKDTHPTVGGENSLVTNQTAGMDTDTTYYINHLGKVFTISTGILYGSSNEENKQREQILNQILSTFKFL